MQQKKVCVYVCCELFVVGGVTLKKVTKSGIIETRKGCKDVFNAYMCETATFTKNDIPICPTTATSPPKEIITWVEAKSIYKKQLRLKNADFKHDAFVCFYIDDYKFDGPRGIWHDSAHALKVLRHFAGVITPDFSTNQDFPMPWKVFNTYRMRTFGYWLGKNGIPVINNLRWGSAESYWYCFDGVEKNSIIAIGTCGGSPKKLVDRKGFEDGLAVLVDKLQPHTIVVYGSANYECFEKLKNKGIKIIAFSSETAKAFERRKSDE